MKKVLALLCVVFMLMLSGCDISEKPYNVSSSICSITSEFYDIPTSIIDDPESDVTNPETPTNKTISAIDGFNYSAVNNLNRNSGGYVIDINDTLYFSNSDDDNCLYKKTFGHNAVFEKVGSYTSEFLFSSLQYAGNKLFYLKTERLNEYIQTEFATIVFSNNIMCFDLNTQSENILIATNVIDYVVFNECIYYTTYDETHYGSLFCYSIPDNSINKLEDFLYPLTIQTHNDKLYLGFNEILIIYDLYSFEKSINMLIHSSFAVCEEAIYYLDLDDSYIYIVPYSTVLNNYDFEDIRKVINIKASSFNVYGGYVLLTEIDSGNLLCVDCNTLETIVIGKGHSPIVNKYGIYYRENDTICLYEFCS